MKKQILTFLSFLLISAACVAQSAEQRAKAEMEFMEKVITLTPEQSKKMLAATTERITVADSLRKDAKVTGTMNQEKMGEIQKKWNDTFKELLPMEVREKYWIAVRERQEAEKKKN